jgi:phosphate transport system permease protein
LGSPWFHIQKPAWHNNLLVSTTTPGAKSANFSTPTPAKREITTKPRFSDKVFRGVATTGGLSSLLILGLIFVFLAFQGFQVLRSEGLGFITGSTWEVVQDNTGNTDLAASQFGIAAMLVGTVICATIAVIIAVPISVLCALFLTFYAPNFIKRIMVALIDLMAAFPSILFGMWGYFVLMPHAEYWAKLLHKYFGWLPFFKMDVDIFERSPFIAGVVLATMIIPIITSISREIFSQTPLDRIQAAYALGATRWAMIKAVVIPYGRSGVVGGAMLGLGRAMGETVAVYTVLNLVYQINWQVLIGAGGNVASMILLKFGEAGPTETRALMAAGLALFILTLIVNSIANAIVTKTGGKGR